MSRWIAVITAAMLVPSAWGQATGSILGTVSDTTGGVIKGARVSATNVWRQFWRAGQEEQTFFLLQL